MNKRSQIIIIFSACVFSLTAFWSCDGKKEPPPKAAVVKKKIGAQTPSKAKSKAGRKAAARSKRAKLQPKSDIAKAAPPTRVARKPSTAKPTVKSSVSSLPAASTPVAAQPAASKSATARPVASTPVKAEPVASAPGAAAQATSQQPAQAPEASAFKPKSDIAVAAKSQPQETAAARNDTKVQPVKTPAVKPKPVSGEKKTAAKRKKPGKSKPKAKAKAEWDAKAKAAAKSKAEPPPPYNPIGKTDPFEPLFKDQPEVPAAKTLRKKRVPRTPLERIALSQLKLVGIIQAPSGNRALVQEASGKGYIIKKGTYIGLNTGKVTEIRRDVVIIEEEVENVLGNVLSHKKELKLPKPPGE